MRIDEAILIMENERPHCGDKLTFTEEERHEAYTWAIGALKELSSAQLEERTKERTLYARKHTPCVRIPSAERRRLMRK